MSRRVMSRLRILKLPAIRMATACKICAHGLALRDGDLARIVLKIYLYHRHEACALDSGRIGAGAYEAALLGLIAEMTRP